MRLRILFTFIILGLIIIDVGAIYYFNLNNELDILNHLKKISSSFLYGCLSVIFLVILRKITFDYPEANFEDLGKKSNRSSEGAGLYAISISIQILAYAVIFISVFLHF